MRNSLVTLRFAATLMEPAGASSTEPWSFLVLPKRASDSLPRRGRTSVSGTLNGVPFEACLEPDGQLSHWLRIPDSLRILAGAEVGGEIEVELAPVETEPEPVLPADFKEALDQAPEAGKTWFATTVLARVDWIHWIEMAKQERTRAKRIDDALDMLGKGKKRVCCFDPSGFYSKAFGAPKSTRTEE